jgi:hypothetical protein
MRDEPAAGDPAAQEPSPDTQVAQGPSPEANAAARRRDLASVDGIVGVTEDTAQKLIHAIEHSRPVRHLRGSQIATAILGAVGFALFVVGVERAASDIPIVENQWGSIAVGLVLLAATGLLVRKLME